MRLERPLATLRTAPVTEDLVGHNAAAVLDDLVNRREDARDILDDEVERWMHGPCAVQRVGELPGRTNLEPLLIVQVKPAGHHDVPASCVLEISKQVSIKGAHLGTVADEGVVIARALVDVAPRAKLPILEAARGDVLLRLPLPPRR